MKQKFSTFWKSSKQPRKQRKYIANAPLHLKRKLLSVNLSKELRKKYGKRNIVLRKGDKVKIMRGKFKKKQGKVIEVHIKRQKIILEGIQVKKQDGSKANVPLRASNLQIIELNLDDKKRMKSIKQESKKTEMQEVKKLESKKETKEEAK
jgi:large subunit ribosomal protein L24